MIHNSSIWSSGYAVNRDEYSKDLRNVFNLVNALHPNGRGFYRLCEEIASQSYELNF
jgi:hypothetical protein